MNEDTKKRLIQQQKNLNGIKDQIFKSKSGLYPLHPIDHFGIENMTFIRILNRSIRLFEIMDDLFTNIIENNSNIIVMYCTKCNDNLFMIKNKKTANCLVCSKRHKIE